jgi:hypothetical protein
MSVVEGEVSPTFAVVDTIAEERWLSADSEGWKQCESQDGPERDEADQRVWSVRDVVQTPRPLGKPYIALEGRLFWWRMMSPRLRKNINQAPVIALKSGVTPAPWWTTLDKPDLDTSPPPQFTSTSFDMVKAIKGQPTAFTTPQI